MQTLAGPRPRVLHWSLTALAAAAVLCLALAPAAALGVTGPDYAYWYSYAQVKVYPTSLLPESAPRASQSSAPTLGLAAAQAEAEGRQVDIRPFGAGLVDIWFEPSDLIKADGSTIPAKHVSVFKVGYVNVTEPSWGTKERGIQPDPLLPMTLANGERLGWRPGTTPNLGLRGVGANTTQPFYVLFEVPKTAAPGTYTGTLRVTCTDAAGMPAPEVAIPVSLTVYPFSVAQRTLKTMFGLNLHDAAIMNSASRNWLTVDPDPAPGATRVAERTTYQADQINGWLKYMSDHRVTPKTVAPAFGAGTGIGALDGNFEMVARHDVLEDYLGPGTATTFEGDRFDFNTFRMPEYAPPPWVKNPFKNRVYTSRAAHYYSSLTRELGPHVSEAYAFPIDEPSASKRKLVEKYAKLVHRYAPGVKFLLTTDPTTQKGKLVRGVDAYVEKLHFRFRDTGWVRKIRKARKELWIYSHATNWQSVTPLYLIDKPVTDSRVQGWYAFKSRADGLLYWEVANWHGSHNRGAVIRDPYTEPNGRHKTYHGKRLAANGDGTLVYPGYYPALGLYVEGSPPVGSLRMEAVRDGLEDYEYLKLVAARYGTPAADAYVGRIIGRMPKPKAGRLAFPPWQKSPDAYEQVRAEMGAALSQ